MKILLAAVNAKYIHSNLAVYSLKAACRSLGGQIEVGEYTINQRMDEILSDIYKKQPDVVAFSCYIWNRTVISMLAEELPRLLPAVRLWAGGPEASWDAVNFLKENPQVRGVMRGEGEGTFRELAAYYIEGKGMLGSIQGLTFYGDGGQIVETPEADPLDMDALPFAYADLYRFKNKIIYYESSRGCPFGCSYCLSSAQQGVRFRSLGLVERELSLFLEEGIPQVKFVDRTFNCAPERTKRLWRWIRDHDNGVTNFHFEVSADLLTEEELGILEGMRPGLVQLEAGVQSTNPAVLHRIGRAADLARLRENIGRIKGFGNIHQHLDLIAGLPGEDLESFQKSFDDVFSMKPEQLQLGFLKVLKGTKLQVDASRYGIVCHSSPPYEVFFTDSLSYGDILLLKGVEEMVEVYYNSAHFSCTLEAILKRYRSPFDFFRELALYYEDKGYSVLNHARMARYDILRTFLQEKGWGDRLFGQCMLHDLYMRENIKSRPAWAPEPGKYKERLREYIRMYGRKVHIEAFEQEKGPVFVLYDYDRRNPLTKGAYVKVL